MITKVIAQGFKGLDFDQAIGPRTILIGPNGAGKSARTQALQLAINGFVIGAGKTNDDILSTFGTGDKLVVGVQVEGMLFERGFVRQPSGSVSQGYKLNGARASKEFFHQSLGECGSPSVINVADFMDLSDQKKLEAILSLYPPDGDMAAVQGRIDATKDEINTLVGQVKTSEQAAGRLVASKAEIKLPAGNVAELDAQIAALDGELKAARDALAVKTKQEELTKPASIKGSPGPLTGDQAVVKSTAAAAITAIEAIIAAMDRAGCSACAARMVAQRELKNLKGA